MARRKKSDKMITLPVSEVNELLVDAVTWRVITIMQSRGWLKVEPLVQLELRK